jgi:hypothetical protein
MVQLLALAVVIVMAGLAVSIQGDAVPSAPYATESGAR